MAGLSLKQPNATLRCRCVCGSCAHSLMGLSYFEAPSKLQQETIAGPSVRARHALAPLVAFTVPPEFAGLDSEGQAQPLQALEVFGWLWQKLVSDEFKTGLVGLQDPLTYALHDHGDTTKSLCIRGTVPCDRVTKLCGGYFSLYVGKCQRRPGRQERGSVRITAHRFLCYWFNGVPPAAGLTMVTHTCGHADCLNPRHLRWANAQENAAARGWHAAHGRGHHSLHPPGA